LWANESDIVKALGLPTGRPVILLVGGADSFDRETPQESEPRNRLLQLFGRGLLRAADAAGPTIIDGGTKAGVMALLGDAARYQPQQVALVGVAPAGKVLPPDGTSADADGRAQLEPNHTHFVLVDSGTWGGETSTLVDLAQTIADTRPVVVVVVHGGEVTKEELVRSVRRHWPIIVVAGFGGLADDIAELRGKPNEFVSDPRLAEVLADGRLLPFQATDSPPALSRLISLQLGGSDTLQRAFDLRARYAHNARSQQDGFFRLQWAILGLGVLGTGLALVYDALGDPALVQHLMQQFGVSEATLGQWAPLRASDDGAGAPVLDRGLLHHLIVLIPLLTSVLLSASVRFNSGASWVALRSSAEAIKAETFRYRAKAGTYSDRETIEKSRDLKLSERLASINQRLMQTQANVSALPDPAPRTKTPSTHVPSPSDKGKDELGFLTPDGYVRNRLEDQRDYYRHKAAELDGTLFRYQALIWAAGLIGSFLAAIGYELWIALTTGLAASFGAYLKYRNVERTLTGYNQATAELDNVVLWWSSLTTGERADQVNIDRLVDATESVLSAENSAWLQQMQNVLEGLREQQRKDNTSHASHAQETSNAGTTAPATETTAAARPAQSDLTQPGDGSASAGANGLAAPARTDGGGVAEPHSSATGVPAPTGNSGQVTR
jgi:hypothetical protein